MRPSSSHALLGQFLFRILVFREVRKAHATQDVGGFRELDVLIADYLDAIAPRIAKIQEGAIQRSDTSRFQRVAGCLLVIDNQAEMSTIVHGLLTALLKGYELVTQIDNGHRTPLPAQFEREEAAIERQRLLDVSYFERDVVNAYGARLCRLGHQRILRFQPRFRGRGRAGRTMTPSGTCRRPLFRTLCVLHSLRSTVSPRAAGHSRLCQMQMETDMIREILKMGDPRLLRVARPIEDIHDPTLKTIIADMYETMHATNGVCLALPQIGIDLRPQLRIELGRRRLSSRWSSRRRRRPHRFRQESDDPRFLQVCRKAREGRQVHRLDDPGIVLELRGVFPHTMTQYKPEAEWPIELDAVFDRALAGTVALAGGGAVHIEATRSAVLIDVDTGSQQTGSPERTGLAVNLAAVDVITRQIRLRNLGGGIVIDFVGLEDRRSRERLREALAEALAPDPRCPQVLGWTRLGHLELVRPRRGRPLAEALLEPGPRGHPVKTAVTVAYEALYALRGEARTQPGRRWRVTVSPEVAAALAGGATAALRALEERFGREIDIEADPSLDRGRFQITPV